MQRGDVVVIADRAGGDYAAKPRPAVVIQSDMFGGTDSIVVCPLTTRERDATLLRVLVSPSKDLPLTDSCWAMVEKITSVRRDRAKSVIGRMTREEMLVLERSLAVFLGFA
jgi:mRNA interferase MazF